MTASASRTPFFADIEQIRYEGPESDNPLAFRWYDPDRVVRGKTMAEHLRFGVCYWHSFAWDGSDIFGAGTLDRPWNPATASGAAAALPPMDAAKLKMEAAFEFFEKLGAPFFSFHDIDIAPAGASFAETARSLPGREPATGSPAQLVAGLGGGRRSNAYPHIVSIGLHVWAWKGISWASRTCGKRPGATSVTIQASVATLTGTHPGAPCPVFSR